MDSSEKRYRVQIQFDIYADSDKESVKKATDGMEGLLDTHNESIIYVAQNSFGELQNREIDHKGIESQLFNEKWEQLRSIVQELPFLNS
jgi:hypothetical protein